MLMKSLFDGGRICEEFSPGYYGICAAGGMLSAGATHLAITPFDVLKVHMQVHPLKYNTISKSFVTLLREEGPSAFWRGRGGKFFGYGIQGACRFGLYEYFKKVYSNLLVDQNKSVVFFVSSASAEVIANVALCPFEVIKIRVQAQPHFAKGLMDGVPKLYASEGISGFYRGLVPLWGRNLPSGVSDTYLGVSYGYQSGLSVRHGYDPYFGGAMLPSSNQLVAEIIWRNILLLNPEAGVSISTNVSMIMFSTFEHTVNFIYRNVIERRKEDCSKAQQLGVTCLAGYAAGSVGSIITTPADNLVASLCNKKASSLRMAVKNIGFINLFTRSLPIRIMLVGPVVTLQWLFYDSIKVLSGLPTSGGVHSARPPKMEDLKQKRL